MTLAQFLIDRTREGYTIEFKHERSVGAMRILVEKPVGTQRACLEHFVTYEKIHMSQIGKEELFLEALEAMVTKIESFIKGEKPR